MTISKRQALLYKYLKKHPSQHPTAEEIYDVLKKEDPKLGIATVYRNLKSLVLLGYIREMNIAKQGVRYDLLIKEHYHFICDQCGTIENFELSTLNNISQVIEKKLNAKILFKDLLFHGYCQECNKGQDSIQQQAKQK